MSRAFVKDQEDAPEELPERPVSPNRNFVTPRGLRQIDEKLETLRRELAHAQHESDRSARVKDANPDVLWIGVLGLDGN